MDTACCRAVADMFFSFVFSNSCCALHHKSASTTIRKRIGYSPEVEPGLAEKVLATRDSGTVKSQKISMDSRGLRMEVGDYALLLKRPLQDHVLPTSVEVSDGVAGWALADSVGAYAVVIRLEAIVGPGHCDLMSAG
jgi:hypothetical protein